MIQELPYQRSKNQIIYYLQNPMTELIPELNKLRNKDCDLWCILWWYEDEYAKELTYGTFINYSVPDEYTMKERVMLFNGEIVLFEDYDFEYIGHPLTRWRICSVAYSAPYSDRIFSIHMNIVWFLGDNPILYDQNELQRQLHPKRLELKELLIKLVDCI